MKIAYQFFFFTFLITSLTACNGNGNLKGSVLKISGGRPEADADVYLLTSDSSKNFKAISDAQGNFLFNAIPSGEYYLLTVSKDTIKNNIEFFTEIYNYLYKPFIGFDKKDSALARKTHDAIYDLQLLEVRYSQATQEKKELISDSIALKKRVAAQLCDTVLKKIPQNALLINKIHFYGPSYNNLKLKPVTIIKNWTLTENVNMAVRQI